MLKGTPYNLRPDAQVDLSTIVLKSSSFGGGTQDGGGTFLETGHTRVIVTIALAESQSPSVQMDTRAQRPVFDQRPARAPAHAPEQGTPPGPTTKVPQTKPPLPPAHLSGKTSIAEGHIVHLTFQQMTADVSLIPGRLKSTQHIHVYAGLYQGNMQVDLAQREPIYALDATLLNLDVGQAIHALTSVRNILLGVLNADVRLVGRGLSWDLMSRPLSGEGNVNIREAKLATFDLIPKLLQVLHAFGVSPG
jgi:hypothetical protein